MHLELDCCVPVSTVAAPSRIGKAVELSDLTLEEALRSYSSVKGHRTRVEKEIGNLLRLLTNNYSAKSEERLNDRLEKLEKHTHKLSDIAEYLITLKYAKACDHRDERSKRCWTSAPRKFSLCFMNVTPPLRKPRLFRPPPKQQLCNVPR